MTESNDTAIRIYDSLSDLYAALLVAVNGSENEARARLDEGLPRRVPPKASFYVNVTLPINGTEVTLSTLMEPFFYPQYTISFVSNFIPVVLISLLFFCRGKANPLWTFTKSRAWKIAPVTTASAIRHM